ncbi:MAG: hypothetical protein R3E44_15725 [Paracoccaceae bacterium]
MNSNDLKETASKAASAAKEAGREAVDSAKSVAREAASDAKDALRDEARARAEAGKDTVADQGQRVARKIRESAEAKDKDSFQSRLLDTIANGVSGFSEDIRGRSLSSLVEEAEGLARRHPGAFVAGAAVAGFALARFARASGDHSDASSEAARVTRPEFPS